MHTFPNACIHSFTHLAGTVSMCAGQGIGGRATGEGKVKEYPWGGELGGRLVET